MKDFLFIFSHKNNENASSNEKQDVSSKMPEILKHFLSNPEFLNFKKSVGIKPEKIEENFDMIYNFLKKKTPFSFAFKDLEDEFILKVLGFENLENSDNSSFRKFVLNLEYFLSICYVFFIVRICELFYEKSKQIKEKSPYNAHLSETSSNLDLARNFALDNLSDRAKIGNLIIKFEDDTIFNKKAQTFIYKELENDEDLLIMKLMQEKQRMNPFYYSNLMESLEVMKENNELLRNLLPSSRNLKNAFINNSQMPMFQSSPQMNFKSFYTNSAQNLMFLKPNPAHLLKSQNFPLDGFKLESNHKSS